MYGDIRRYAVVFQMGFQVTATRRIPTLVRRVAIDSVEHEITPCKSTKLLISVAAEISALAICIESQRLGNIGPRRALLDTGNDSKKLVRLEYERKYFINVALVFSTDCISI